MKKEKVLELLKMLEESTITNYELVEQSEAENFDIDDILDGIREDVLSVTEEGEE